MQRRPAARVYRAQWSMIRPCRFRGAPVSAPATHSSKNSLAPGSSTRSGNGSVRSAGTTCTVRLRSSDPNGSTWLNNSSGAHWGGVRLGQPPHAAPPPSSTCASHRLRYRPCLTGRSASRYSSTSGTRWPQREHCASSADQTVMSSWPRRSSSRCTTIRVITGGLPRMDSLCCCARRDSSLSGSAAGATEALCERTSTDGCRVCRGRACAMSHVLSRSFGRLLNPRHTKASSSRAPGPPASS